MVISIPSYEQSLGIPRLEHESSTLYISSNYTVKVDVHMLCVDAELGPTHGNA